MASYTLKGFAVLPAFIDNTTDVTAPFGELSTYARTFSYEQKIYRSATYPASLLNVFTSKTDTVDNADVTDYVRDNLLIILQWMYDRSTSGSVSSNSITEAAAILAEFTAEISNVECGTILDNGINKMPSYISFEFTGYNGGEDNYIKIWFSDADFITQYDEYEIRVVTPLSTLDDFHTLDHAALGTVLAEQDKSALVTAINSVTAGKPATKNRPDKFTWVSSTSSELTHDTTWVTLIYGPAGDNIDNVRRAITEHVLADSAYDRAVWIDRLPDLFRSNEFIIVPQWDQFAIPTESEVAGVYSSTISVKGLVEKVTPFYPNYDPVHLLDVMAVTSTPFNYVQAVVVGGPENKDNAWDFYLKFPDYFSTGTDETDFSRMSLGTRQFSEKLLAILTVAETATNFSQLPTGINRITRDGKMYISQNHDGVEYMAISKQSYLEVING